MSVLGKDELERIITRHESDTRARADYGDEGAMRTGPGYWSAHEDRGKLLAAIRDSVLVERGEVERAAAALGNALAQLEDAQAICRAMLEKAHD